MTGPTPPGGPADREHVVRVERFPGPRSTALYLAVAAGDPALPLPGDGGLRLHGSGPHGHDPQVSAGRLAARTLRKHRFHHTGFRGAEMVVTGADRLDDEVLRTVAAVLNSRAGTLWTGAGPGVDAADTERLAGMTPYVLDALDSDVEPHAATAHGVLGAVEAWAGGPPAGLRVLVHGVGKVGAVLAAELAAAGAEVLTYDVDAGATAPPGCRPVRDWAGERVDVLLPCSVGEPVDRALAGRLRCGAVIGPADAAPADERLTREVLRRRGIARPPNALVGAGAVVVDSIEHYAPRAFRVATAHRVYAFVRETVRTAAAGFPATAASGTAAPPAPPPGGMDLFCGLRFDGWGQPAPKLPGRGRPAA